MKLTTSSIAWASDGTLEQDFRIGVFLISRLDYIFSKEISKLHTGRLYTQRCLASIRNVESDFKSAFNKCICSKFKR